MKKLLKITAITIGCIFLLMIILPFAFKGKIDEIIKREGNKMLNAEFDYKDLDISLFKNFPHLSVAINDLTLNGTGEFENETLINAGNITAAVNIMSIFGGDGYEISKVLLENIYLKAIKLSDGKVNWDILKSSETAAEKEPEQEPEPAAEDGGALKIMLKSIVFKNINIIYDDRMDGIYADVKDLGLTMSGNLGTARTEIDLETAIKAVTLRMQNTAFLKNASVSAKINLDADLENNKFILKKSDARLNAVKIKIDGWAALPENGIDMDIKIGTNDIKFTDLLSLVPAGYIKDLDKIKTGGSVALSIAAKGLLEGDKFPSFDAALTVKDASFRYPDLPASVDDINILASAVSPGGSLDNIYAEVSAMSFKLDGNPFNIAASVKTPISDPDFSASAKGVLDLGKVKDVYPLDNITISGILNADVNAAGKLSYLGKKLYDKFDVSGELKLEKTAVALPGMPEIKIAKSVFSFTPKYLSLTAEDVNLDKNDVSAQCRFENYIGFALKNETIKGSLKVTSKYFNLNDFIETGDTGEKQPGETTAEKNAAPAAESPESKPSAIEVPKNIDFVMDTDMKKILFGNMTFDNFKGRLKIKNGEIDMENISFDTMGGSIGLGGLYSTKNNPAAPKAKASLDVKNISFSRAYNDLNIIRQIAPIFANLKGSFSGDVSLDLTLDETMSPVLNTVNGSGSFKANNISLSNVKAIDGIADILKKDELKNINTKDINLSFGIKNGRLTTKPFDIKTGDTVIRLSGSTGLDQTIDYSGQITLPASAAEKTKLTRLDLKIGGTFTSPKVSIDTRSMINQALDTAKDKAAEELKKRGVDLENAMKQKEALIETARKTGNKLIEEAEKQVDKLKEQAGNNPIKKFAAEKTGEELIKEARNQADKLIENASKEGDELIEKIKNGL